MKTLTAFYFSGTGNTRYITEYLCNKLSSAFVCETADITTAKDLDRKFADSDVILLAFPIYGSSPPIPMRKFVHRCGERFRGKDVVIVETQYFYSGDGAASLGRTVKKYGGNPIGAEMFDMPNNLADCTVFSIRNGEEIRPTLERARRRADRFAEKLIKGKARLRGFSVFSHAVGYYTQRKFWRRGEQEKRGRLTVDPSRCVGCGLCAKRCPADNLILQNSRAKPLGVCVLCYRCVNLCPKKAISLIGKAPPATQYRGPAE